MPPVDQLRPSHLSPTCLSQTCLSVCARQAQGGGPVDWTKVEVGLLGLRRTGLDMVSSPGDTVDGRVRAEYARWRRAKGDSPLQPSREGPETNLQINPSTHDTCNAYFDQNTTRLVMQEQRAIYSAFGYVRRAPSPTHPPTSSPLAHAPTSTPAPTHPAYPPPSPCPAHHILTARPHLVSCAGSVLWQGRSIHQSAVVRERGRAH